MNTEKKLKPPTNEQLAIQNSTLAKLLDESNKRDEFLRKEFSKAFGWYEHNDPHRSYGPPIDPKLVTWEQIFVHIGELLAGQKAADNYNLLHDIQTRLQILEIDAENAKINKK